MMLILQHSHAGVQNFALDGYPMRISGNQFIRVVVQKMHTKTIKIQFIPITMSKSRAITIAF